MDKTDQTPAEIVELNFAEGTVPEWVQLIPAGPGIRGIDGRVWTMNDADALVTTFRNRGLDLPIDIEHATQIKGARAEEAPAMGWINDMEARATGLWGQVKWNTRGEELLRARSYRYLSPVFSAAKRTGAVSHMVSAGLTNNPNLDLIALNRDGAEQENDLMDKTVLEALGLNSDGTPAQAVAAITALKEAETTALNRASLPDPEKFVPRADYELALNRAAKFEADEKEREELAINTALDAAIEAGKIAPASREYHLASCQAEGGLARFQSMVDASPVIAGPTDLDSRNTDPAKKETLTSEELAACHALGMSEAEFIAAKSEE
ncbi:phage protease [Halocynthiibacter styelae]|uniref:Mu-like prophage I protein n=1 Tax=Halocynthiibacter styelae TaxID=2761955 RepID=A0A8J7IUT1_9RHOB|nr:phage protease [Paenihalocynthiibacter styelae]MBI1492858.1 hypothetical protein [Paenihalocynthiibacter styelae]